MKSSNVITLFKWESELTANTMSCGSWKNNPSISPRNSDSKPIPLFVCVCVRQQASGYAYVQWVWCVCCCVLLLFPSSYPLTKSLFTPQSIGDSCIQGGVSTLALVHLDHVLRVQQFQTDVKQNKSLRWHWSIENKIRMPSELISFICSAQQQVQ